MRVKNLVLGRNGMLAQAMVREFDSKGQSVLAIGRSECDARDVSQVASLISEVRPEVIFFTAAKVGGIAANMEEPVDFLLDNLEMQCAIFRSCLLANFDGRLVFYGSSCSYPSASQQPLAEQDLFNGSVEPTNFFYAQAKLGGLALARAMRKQYGLKVVSLIPTNTFGPHDCFDVDKCHVIPALIRKFESARRGGSDVVLWGSGRPVREFMYIDDLAKASVYFSENYPGDMEINIGTGEEISISDLAALIGEEVGYIGSVRFDDSKPDGAMRKVLDSSLAASLGWKSTVSIEEGIDKTIAWVRANEKVIV